MGIHVSCDSCYKTVKEGDAHVVVSLTSNNPRFPVKHSFIYCIPCMKDSNRLYCNVDNPNYIAPPAEPKPEEKVSGNEVKSAG
jgi:hypothetical protein